MIPEAYAAQKAMEEYPLPAATLIPRLTVSSTRTTATFTNTSEKRTCLSEFHFEGTKNGHLLQCKLSFYDLESLMELQKKIRGVSAIIHSKDSRHEMTVTEGTDRTTKKIFFNFITWIEQHNEFDALSKKNYDFAISTLKSWYNCQ